MSEKKIRLIFINVLPLSKILGSKLNSWWFNDNGFNVECWDCSLFFWEKKKLESYFGGTSDYKNIGPNQCTIETMEELNQKLEELDNNTIVFYINRGIYQTADDDWLLKKISIKKVKLIFLTYVLAIDKGLVKKILRPLRNFKYYIHNRKHQPAGFVGAGSKIKRLARWMYPKAEFISIPTFNAIWETPSKLIEHKYILFIDENVRYNPDAEMRGITLCHDVDGYYKRMNELFDKVEKYTGLPIVIAGSGKYHYQEDHFNGRELIYSKTFELVANAEIVIAHISSALSQAIIDNKPLLIVDDKSFSDLRRSWFEGVKDKTNKYAILNEDITEDIFLENIRVDAEYNKKTVDKYFKEKNVEGNYKTIVSKAFKQLVNN